MDLAQYLEQCAQEDRAGIDDYIASRAAAQSVTDDLPLDDFLPDKTLSMPPQIFNISSKLIRGCAAPNCSKISNLSRCSACKVVYYCGREHQSASRPSHRSVCSKIKKAQASFEQEERLLRREEGDKIFEDGRGSFWGLLETRDYMRARYTLAEAVLKVNTFQAVSSALEHLGHMLQLCQSDNMGVRDVVPGLYIRLGRDQDAYEFCKWWAIMGEYPDDDFSHTDSPYPGTRNADAFEDVSLFIHNYTSLPCVVTMTLIKLRLLVDLQSLQRAKEEVGPHVPREILDHIQRHAVGSIVANSPKIIERGDQAPYIARLRDQIQKLFYAVQGANPHFWPALLKPGENLRARATSYSHGSKAQMQLVLQYTYNAWSETPGAIGIIETLWRQYEDEAILETATFRESTTSTMFPASKCFTCVELKRVTECVYLVCVQPREERRGRIAPIGQLHISLGLQHQFERVDHPLQSIDMLCDICNQFQGRWPIGSKTESHKHRGDGIRSLQTQFTWDELLSSLTRCYVCDILVRGCRGVFELHGVEETDIEDVSLLFHYPSTIEDVEGADCDKHLTFHLYGGQRFEVELFVTDSDDDPFPEAWDYIATLQRTSTRTDSDEALATIDDWVAECTEAHVDNLCEPIETPQLPKRVVDVGSSSSSVKLFEPSGAKGKYICLSHCWGLEQIITTTTSNLSQHLSSIPWPKLSKTFQEAITLTRNLGFQYIWIDSLCIIQDSASDWAIESSKMASIYSNAHLTLAGTKSPNGAGGLFASTPDFRVTGHTSDGEAYCLYFRERIEHHLDLNLETATSTATEKYYPLLTRAWVYQERMLSPRVLHFGRYEMFFECQSSVQCECGGIAFHGAGEEIPAAIMKIEYANGLAQLHDASQTQIQGPGLSRIQYHAARLWRSLVCTYTSLRLTKSPDRLPAFGGLARQMHAARHSRYIAGLWEDCLQDDLLWSANTHSGLLSARPEPWNAPSWSWASVEVRAGVDYAHGIVYTSLDEDGDSWEEQPWCEHFVNVERCAVRRAEGAVDEFGAVGEGELVVKGMVAEGVLGREVVMKGKESRIEHFVGVGKEKVKMLSDYLLDEEGGNQVLPGARVYCLRMSMLRQGTKDCLVSLVLRRAPSKPDRYERIGTIKGRGAVGSVNPHSGIYMNAQTRSITII